MFGPLGLVPLVFQKVTFSLDHGEGAKHGLRDDKGPISNVELFGGSTLSIEDLNVNWKRVGRLVLESLTVFGNGGTQYSDLTTLESTVAAVQDPVVGLEHIIANKEDHSIGAVAGRHDGFGIDINLDAKLGSSPSFLGTPGVGHDVGRRRELSGTLGNVAAKRGAGLRGGHSGEHSHWTVFGGRRGLIKVEHEIGRTASVRVVVEPLSEIHSCRC